MRSLIVIALIAGLFVVAFLIVKTKHERRFDVYEIATKLERGMSHAAVEKILSDHWRPYMKRGGQMKDGDGAILVITSFGWAEGLFFFIYFQNGKLIGTKMHGEDSTDDRYEDQPPDIPIRE